MHVDVTRTNRTKQQVRRKRPPKETPCGYCFREWATAFDHLIPWSAGGGELDDNLYPTCKRCNSLLHNMIFDSIEAKREYVRSELIRREEWQDDPLPQVWRGIQGESAQDILLPKMPVGCVASKKNGRLAKCP